jgi:hypothetical protein
MIWQWLAHAVSAVVTPVVNLLPTDHLSLPSPAPVASVLTTMNEIVPVAGPLTMAASILSAVSAFVGVRLVLVAWNLIYP